MYNGISKVSAYKCLPSELTRKVNINKAYKGARLNSAVSKAAIGLAGFATIVNFCKEKWDWTALMALLTAFNLFAPNNAYDRALTNNLHDAYKEIVTRAKNVKALQEKKEVQTTN